MPPKAKGKSKKPEEPPKPVPDLEWEEVPNIAESYNFVYNHKIRTRIRSLFSILDKDKKKLLDLDNAVTFVRAAGLFPTDAQLDEWLKKIAVSGEGEALTVEKDTICSALYEVLRQGIWQPPTPKQAVRYWRRLDMAQKGVFNADDLTLIFAQEEKADGMTPTELKKLLKHVSAMAGGELDYAVYCHDWYGQWLKNRIPRPRDRIPGRTSDDTV